MPEPLHETAFEALMEQAGLLSGMTSEEREDIRLATRLAARFAQRVRAPVPLGAEAELAGVFTPREPGP